MNRGLRLILATLACALAAALMAASGEGFSEREAPYEGIWVPFEDGFRLYVPAAWHTFEIPADQARAGLFYRAGNDGGDDAVGETAMGVGVSYMSAGPLSTVEGLARDMVDAGFDGVEILDLNGISAVSFHRSADDYRGVAFFHPTLPEYILQVYISPIGEPGSPVEAVGSAILASLRPNPTD